MASSESVFLAGLVHLMIRFIFYITPQSRLGTPGPAISTAIVGVALLDIIYDNRIIPLRFNDMSAGFQYMVETVVAIVLLEFGMLIWTSIEHSIYLFAKGTLLGLSVVSKPTYYRNENLIIGSFTLPLSLAILIMAAQATDHYQIIRRRLSH
ncbi:uncharacterized protein LOC6561785 [Drosophila grimshawi]|uniref:GH11029 n=1 Tax=Drosophila grimshawi TaxID=7222 RepID=B4JC39_DROGR|nr:uncharacterized protein LOC6561785 [Drosophila grimshawi]EDW03052.1 GH11029 [Drosophila grimshawi]